MQNSGEQRVTDVTAPAAPRPPSPEPAARADDATNDAATAGRVLVLLASYNGLTYLPEQMDSIEAQSWPHVDLVVSDDGSGDGSWDYLEQRCRVWSKGEARLVCGPRAGVTENFRTLLLGADSDASYFAYSDQDDVWLKEKLTNAIGRLEQLPAEIPAMHCARTLLVAKDGKPIGQSRYFTRTPAFQNALVQSLAGGNTMVVNRAAFLLLRAAATATPFPMHDWWTYMVLSGAGGTIIYSPEPDVAYRQHESNVIGSNLGLRAALTRIGMIARGRWVSWNEQNIASLRSNTDRLTPDAQRTLHEFIKAREGPVLIRLHHLWRSGVYRQTFRGNVALYLACLIGKL